MHSRSHTAKPGPAPARARPVGTIRQIIMETSTTSRENVEELQLAAEKRWGGKTREG